MNASALTSTELTNLSKSIIRSLLYYDIFNYPLTFEEIFQYCNQPHVPAEVLQNELDEMVNSGVLFRHGDFYLLQPEEKNIERRKKGNQLAAATMSKAKKMSRLIASFPFVRGVCLSGSISKNYMDESGDVDYFIITEPGRLWVSRMMLVVFKKIFLLNSRKYFCINYFVTTDSLEIEEKNIFTATELVTLIPTFGSNVFNEFRNSNEWTRFFYPNHTLYNFSHIDNSNGWLHKKVIEKILNNRVGNWLDKKFMNLTVRVWKSKFRGFDKNDFEIAFKSKPQVSKHHPNYFQKKVLGAYDLKIKQFETRFNLVLTET